MIRFTFCIALVITAASSASAETHRHGEIRMLPSTQAWNADLGSWETPETFWKSYAQTRGGLTWGERRDYPPYDAVNEHDTLIIVRDSGPCLMEFFHARWRRANDVQRWDPAFNNYAGCADVFE